jgi:hypothetical protein
LLGILERVEVARRGLGIAALGKAGDLGLEQLARVSARSLEALERPIRVVERRVGLTALEGRLARGIDQASTIAIRVSSSARSQRSSSASTARSPPTAPTLRAARLCDKGSGSRRADSSRISRSSSLGASSAASNAARRTRSSGSTK